MVTFEISIAKYYHCMVADETLKDTESRRSVFIDSIRKSIKLSRLESCTMFQRKPLSPLSGF
jgi:hypothetical protein